jgi:hypothetical protein
MDREVLPEAFLDRCRELHPKLPDEAAIATSATMDRETPFLQ